MLLATRKTLTIRIPAWPKVKSTPLGYVPNFGEGIHSVRAGGYPPGYPGEIPVVEVEGWWKWFPNVAGWNAVPYK